MNTLDKIYLALNSPHIKKIYGEVLQKEKINPDDLDEKKIVHVYKLTINAIAEKRIKESHVERKRLLTEKINRIYRKTYKQKTGYRIIADKMQTAQTDMIEHIKDYIKDGYYTLTEFLADPSAYLDSAVMGKYIRNPIIINGIINAIRKEYQI